MGGRKSHTTVGLEEALNEEKLKTTETELSDAFNKLNAVRFKLCGLQSKVYYMQSSISELYNNRSSYSIAIFKSEPNYLSSD